MRFIIHCTYTFYIDICINKYSALLDERDVIPDQSFCEEQYIPCFEI